MDDPMRTFIEVASGSCSGLREQETFAASESWGGGTKPRLRWDEIGDGVFTIPASRHKAKTSHTLPILQTVADLIGNRPKGAEFVFSTQKGTTAFSGFSKAKVALDKEINASRKEAKLKSMPDWRIHDLRRTARSLMSRAGVVSDIAERVLGHVLPGIRGVYDRHGYVDEKRDALALLEMLMERILSPPTEKVVELAVN
jgi:integrase